MITIYHIGQYPDEPDTTYIEGGWKEFCGSDSLYVVATPKVGYRLSQWSNGDTSNVIVTFGGELERNVRSIPAGDSLKTIAYFETDPSKGHLYVSSDNPKVGMVYGGGKYMDSTVVEAYVKNGICARFTHWSDGETANPRVWNKEGTDTLVAYFEESTTHLIFGSADEEQGTVTAQIGSDTLATPYTVIWSETQTITLNAQAKPGYQFAQWNTGSKHSTIQLHTGCDTIKYTAYFEPAKDTFCISIYPDDSNKGRTNNYFCGTAGQKIEKFAEANDGYEFDYWESIHGYSTDTIVGNDTLVAHFKNATIPCKTIVFLSDKEEMGTVEVFSLGGAFMDTTHIQPNRLIFCPGDSIYAVATPKEGYIFSHWNNGDTSEVVDSYGGQLEKDIQGMETDDTMNVVAYFVPDSLNNYLAVSSSNPQVGTVFGGGKYTDSTVVTAYVSPRLCARFTQWSDGDTTNPRVWDKRGKDTLVAYFEESTTHLIFESADEEQGTVTAQIESDTLTNPYTVAWSETLTITLNAQAKPGYQFTQWNTGSKRPTIQLHTGCDTIKYTAYFEPAKDTFCISIYPDDSNKGRTNNHFCGIEGQKIEKFAEANDGYEFDYWESIHGYSTDTIVGNDTLVAHFKKEPIPCKSVVFRSDEEEMGAVEVFSLGGAFMGTTHIQPNQLTLCQNDSMYAVAIPKEGYIFSHWDNGDTSEIVKTYSGQLEMDILGMMADDTLSVVAYFEEIGGMDSTANYLTFTAEEEGSSFSIANINNDPDIQYSINNGKTWKRLKTNEKVVLENKGDKALLRGMNPEGFSESNSAWEDKYTKFVMEGHISASGSVMSLLDRKGVSTTIPSNYCFASLFSDCVSLTEAPELPATTLRYSCYKSMFSGCVILEKAPELPAMELENDCYKMMFQGCTGLKQAPDLPATKLGNNCYEMMFDGCTSLTQAPALPATKLMESCYWCMFKGCTSLTETPELPATQLTYRCYCGMFSGCTGLTSTPELPVTILAWNCYQAMFNGCTGIKQAPILPATVLKPGCYEYMFSGCTNLTSAPELPAMTLAEECYLGMFQNCTSLTQVPELPATVLDKQCYAYMFKGCTGIKEPPTLPDVVAPYCYQAMFCGCTGLTKAPELPATTLEEGCYESMFCECTELTEAPALPSRDAPLFCYYNMFEKCTNLKTAPVLLADSLSSSCFWEMFSECHCVDKIEVSFTEWGNSTVNWLNDVAPTGTFICPKELPIEYGASKIPEGWTVVYKEETNGTVTPLTNNRFSVWAVDLTIHYQGTEKAVEVYGLNGELVARKVAGDDTGSITVPQRGVYIVKSGTESVKVEL